MGFIFFVIVGSSLLQIINASKRGS